MKRARIRFRDLNIRDFSVRKVGGRASMVVPRFRKLGGATVVAGGALGLARRRSGL